MSVCIYHFFQIYEICNTSLGDDEERIVCTVEEMGIQRFEFIVRSADVQDCIAAPKKI